MPQPDQQRVSFCKHCGKEMLWPKTVCDDCAAKQAGDPLWWLPILLWAVAGIGCLVLIVSLTVHSLGGIVTGSALLGVVAAWGLIYTAVRMAVRQP